FRFLLGVQGRRIPHFHGPALLDRRQAPPVGTEDPNSSIADSLIALEVLQKLAGGQVPAFHGLPEGNQTSSVRAVGRPPQKKGSGLESIQFLAAGYFPHPSGPVSTEGAEPLPVGAKGHG